MEGDPRGIPCNPENHVHPPRQVSPPDATVTSAGWSARIAGTSGRKFRSFLVRRESALQDDS